MSPRPLIFPILVTSAVASATALAAPVEFADLATTAAPTDSAVPTPPPRLPVAEAERPITLPPFILSSSLVFDVVRLDAAASYADLTGQLNFGITDDLVVRALVLPLQLSGPAGDGFHYGQTSQTHGPSIGATYRLVRGAVEVGFGLDLRVFTSENLTGGAIIPSVPVRIHASKRARVDITPQLNVTRATATTTASHLISNAGGDGDVEITTANTSANAVRLNIPVTFIYNVIEPFFVEATSGLTVDNLSNTSNTTGIPLGASLGYTVAGKAGPILDIGPSINFPYLFTPAAKSTTDTGEYVIGLSVVGYSYF